MKEMKLLSTVAVTLLLGASAASAQGMNKETPERAPPAQQNAPAEKVAPSMKGGEQKAPETRGQATPGAKSDKEPQTTGQGAVGAARLSTEQRTKITSIIRQHKVEPAQLNVSVTVGTRIPERVHVYPLPVEVVDIYPEWRGYDYILVGDQIVIIDPRTHEIVAIVEA